MSITLRSATKDDSSDIARIHVQGWRDSYEYIVDQDYLDALSVEERTKDWQSWFDDGKVNAAIAEIEDGEAVGFAGFGKLRTPIPGQSPIRPLYTGEIYGIYILKEYWRQGIGTALLKEAADNLRGMKHKSMALWVLDRNKRAQKFYKTLGGQRCGKRQTEIGGRDLKEVCYGWRDTVNLIESA